MKIVENSVTKGEIDQYMTNLSFCHAVFTSHLQHMRQNVSVYGKGLMYKHNDYVDTSACCPGVSILPHSLHRRQLGCHSFPSEVFLSAVKTNRNSILKPKFYIELYSLNNIERRPPKEYSCEVLLKLVE